MFVLSLLGAGVLWGCGGEVPASSARASDEFLAVAQAANASSPTHGREIDLPIWNVNLLPSNWEAEEIETLGWFVKPRSGAQADTVDWNGGNALYNVLRSHMPVLDVRIEKGEGYQVIGRVTGYFTNIQPGLVRGSIYMEMEAFSAYSPPSVTDDIQLVLQVEESTGWRDVQVKNMRLTESFYAEVESMLSPGVDVRFEVRARKRTASTRLFAVNHLRMFGAQCYPDFASPGNCL